MYNIFIFLLYNDINNIINSIIIKYSIVYNITKYTNYILSK